MKEKPDKREKRRRLSLLLSIVLIFCIWGTIIYAISKKTSQEMSESAIQNLSESLDLIQSTIEAILQSEAEFQILIAQEIARVEDPEAYVRTFEKNQTMAKLSLIRTGKTEGVSSTGEVFTEEELDFSAGGRIEGLEISQSYINYMGTWSYTIKCPVEQNGQVIGNLYAEYIYDAIDKSLPNGFYNKQASLYIMDAESKRFVLKPKGMGQREAGHLNLDDFYRANNIQDTEIQREVVECLESGRNILFYHDIRDIQALNYMWSVNDGTIFLVGYVPVEAIQREGQTVNRSILIVVASMLAAFFLCIVLYYFNWKQQDKIRREREEERKVYNQQLAEALQAAQIASESKTTFLSNMSHDIRTPMNAVLGFTTLLAKDAENPLKVREYTKKIMASGQHLLSLINDILDVSKIESGKVVLNYEKFALNDVISSVETIIQPMAKARGQEFHLEVTGIRYEYLEGDETRLNQILINLLSNAVKYTPEGGDIWFRVIGLKQRSSQYESIRIEVEDNGYGMTPEYLKTIFDAFTRAENSTTNKVQGTGLGMAITKSIVDLMGGTIDVFSEVNRGTLFRVDLELRILEAQPGDKNKELEIGEEEDLSGLHFLAAEDNEINAEILVELLDLEGASCEIVENGQLAVERFRQAAEGEFDAILMDVQMPVMNGHEAARAIRSLKRDDAGSVPIIAMTANAFAEDEKAALDAGMDAHVAKPLDMELLKKVIKQCARRKETP
ncbi:hybrid sensor histidine kinase/response regulator [Hominifimenecus sp. rT4P-3]|uniref:hybrid sensor histidine kinase/response regulator n=1 Tax=Hominifimenecus sp. rT4P-3 TaxID=3242979 RepID=UPI003DA258F2